MAVRFQQIPIAFGLVSLACLLPSSAESAKKGARLSTIKELTQFYRLLKLAFDVYANQQGYIDRDVSLTSGSHTDKGPPALKGIEKQFSDWSFQKIAASSLSTSDGTPRGNTVVNLSVQFSTSSGAPALVYDKWVLTKHWSMTDRTVP